MRGVMSYNRKDKLKKNILAVKTVLSIARGKRMATEQEKEILREYSGFGGLKCILYPLTGDDSEWTKSDLELKPLVSELYGAVLEGTASEYEYREYVHSLKNSVLTSFYTPAALAESIVKALLENGAVQGRILEPSAGTGIFASVLEKSCPWANITAFEKDRLACGIFKALHPHVLTYPGGFENASEGLSGQFGLVISNIPFGDVQLYDSEYSNSPDPVKKRSLKAIHNYFFLKGLDMLSEGGLLAYIATQGVFNSPGNADVRRWLAERSDVVSLIRLPNNLFKEDANTEAAAALVVLQKNSAKRDLNGLDKKFIESVARPDGYNENALFDESNTVFTESRLDTNQYGEPAKIFVHEGGAAEIGKAVYGMLSPDLQAGVDFNLLKGISRRNEIPAENVENGEGQADFEYDLEEEEEASLPPEITEPYVGEPAEFYQDGWMVRNGDGRIGILRKNASGECRFRPLALPEADAEKAALYISIRDGYEKLYSYEAEFEKENRKLRQLLNRNYDRFVRNYGQFHKKKNAKLIMEDIAGRNSLALERKNGDSFCKADIFRVPVAFSTRKVTYVNNADESLAASLNKYGHINLAYMSMISGIGTEDLLRDLKGRIYYNPMLTDYEVSEKFISGDVVSKAEKVKRYLDEAPSDGRIRESFDALMQSRPKEIPYEDIDLAFGSRWMEMSWFESYAGDLLDADVEIIYSPSIDTFQVFCRESNANIYEKYCIQAEDRSINAISLLTHALHNTVPIIRKSIRNGKGEEVKIEDGEKMQLAGSMIDEIRNGFTEWLNRQPMDFREKIAKLYNRKMNCLVRPNFDGSHQSFPDLDMAGLRIKGLYKSQKDAVWMIKTNGGGIVDHQMGTGKTNTICISTYEMKRLGMVHKPMIICLKSNVHAVAKAFKDAYPNARVLFPSETDFEKKNRHRLFNEMKNNNWSAIILTHDQFAKIPPPSEIKRKIMQEELIAVEDSLDILRRQGEDITSRMRCGLEKRKAKLTAELSRLDERIRKRSDDMVDMGNLGIDYVAIDESHYQNFSKFPEIVIKLLVPILFHSRLVWIIYGMI